MFPTILNILLIFIILEVSVYPICLLEIIQDAMKPPPPAVAATGLANPQIAAPAVGLPRSIINLECQPIQHSSANIPHVIIIF
jgi:hypothetical protein